jgi:heptosyltransferase-2
MSKQHPKRILIIRLSSLGDILLSTPLIRALRSRFQNAQIHYLVFREYSDILRFNPHLNKIIQIPRISRLREYKDLGMTLRPYSYDLVLDLHSSLRSTLIRFYSRLSSIIMVNKNYFKRWLLVYLKRNLYAPPYSMVSKYFSVVKHLQVLEDEKGLEIFIDEETRQKVNRLFREQEFHGKVVGIAPRARWETKCWPLDNYAILAKELCFQGFHVVLLGSESERPACEQIRHAAVPAVWNAAGKMTILESAELLRRCDILVCNDSGPMHLACAVSTPVAAIFGNTCKEFGFYPYHNRSHIFSLDLECKPCHHIGLKKCPKDHFSCMENIKPGTVLEAVKKIL